MCEPLELLDLDFELADDALEDFLDLDDSLEDSSEPDSSSEPPVDSSSPCLFLFLLMKQKMMQRTMMMKTAIPVTMLATKTQSSSSSSEGQGGRFFSFISLVCSVDDLNNWKLMKTFLVLFPHRGTTKGLVSRVLLGLLVTASYP